MNARKAKKLRREAEQATIGKDSIAYRGESIRQYGLATISLDPSCTRGVYQKLKREKA